MRILLIGAGNVGTYLGLNLHQSGHQIAQVFSRRKTRARVLAQVTSAEVMADLSEIQEEADIVILAIHDDGLDDVFEAIRSRTNNSILLHTAGSVSIDIFKGHQKYGVLWPVQTLSVSRHTPSRDVPLIIHGNTESVTSALEKLALGISDNVHRMDDSRRAFLHLAATFANNFSNHMFAIAEDIARAHDIDFDILKPLIRETALKVNDMSPRAAQTGAAIRHDQSTIDRHERLLSEHPELKELYALITRHLQSL